MYFFYSSNILNEQYFSFWLFEKIINAIFSKNNIYFGQIIIDTILKE